MKMLDNLAPVMGKIIPLLQEWWSPISKLGVLMGFLIILGSLFKMASINRQEGVGVSFRKFVVSWFAGIMLVNFSLSIKMISNTFFNASLINGLSYIPPKTDTASGIYVQFSIYIVMLIGLIGVITGFSLLNQSAEDPSKRGKAMTHIIGGIFAVNIVTLVSSIGTFFGGDIGLSIKSLIG